MKLIIVESPTKARTISQFVGEGYQVESSYGHVRDLPKSKLGVDIENNFALQYVTPKKNQKTVNKLKKTAAKADELILATDEDREGEAIAWHLYESLGTHGNMKDAPPGSIQRIVFHEITKSAIDEALKNPRSINMDLVNAQQARRVLDRLVGYKLSPFLWKKISRGLSAGRVQSVALRLIADRETEIQNFKPEEYWSLAVNLATESGAHIETFLYNIDGKTIDKLFIKNEAEADRIKRDLETARYRIASIDTKEVKKNPPAPFTTSTLNQEAAKRLGFTSKKTMFIAQNLYENGHITYMRTDSVNLSKESVAAGMRWIKNNLGARYALDAPRIFKTKSRLAQEAHEAIRPSTPEAEPKTLAQKLEKDQGRLYDLIWRRFTASQLPEALFDATRIEVLAETPSKKTYGLNAHGTMIKFDGFLKIWPMKFEEKELPRLSKNEKLEFESVKPEQHFTEPPPRYNEASLIKTLEKYGIGRPSTYAPTISVIQERNYVEKNQGRFYPTEVGMLVNKVLTENFPEIVDIQFTAKMEEELDEIAEGGVEWQKIIKNFYDPFAKHLEEKYESVLKHELVNETTDEKCEKCGRPMVIKFGRFGKFMACSGFPECKNTKTLKDPPRQIGMKCPTCLEAPERKENPGEVIERRVVKRGRARGKIFWGCSRYPDCNFSSWTNPLNPPAEKEKGAETEKSTP